MKFSTLRRALAGAAAVVFFSAFSWIVGLNTNAQAQTPGRGRVVVANRASANLSVIDVRTNTVTQTVPMPDGGEPMYVVYSPEQHRVFVGDRLNSRVVVFDAADMSVETTVPAGQGVFHMWAGRIEDQLWVAGDGAKTVTVIGTTEIGVITTIPMPADLVGAGFIPHDVFVDPLRASAYVTMIKSGTPSFVVKFSTTTFAETGRREVGIDAHLSQSISTGNVYVPSQGSNAVWVLNRDTLADATPPIAIPGAHGAAMDRLGRFFYTTNLPGGGVSGLFGIDTATNQVFRMTDTPPGAPIATPHNVVLTPNNRTLYLTHSGSSSTSVTVYAVAPPTSIEYVTTVTVGSNPFGLDFVP